MIVCHGVGRDPHLPESEYLRYFPNLCQYRYGDDVRYRHPDDSWQETPPDGDLPALWVHDLAQMAYLHRARQILCPHWWRGALLEGGLYQIRTGEDHCLLTRRSSAKSARSAITLP